MASSPGFKLHITASESRLAFAPGKRDAHAEDRSASAQSSAASQSNMSGLADGDVDFCSGTGHEYSFRIRERACNIAPSANARWARHYER